MPDTLIEWTDKTWNPTTGCTKVSPGCANCYITRTPPFRINHRKFEHVGNEMTTGVILHPDRLEHPLKWRKPQRIFVNSMSDLFHDDVPDEFVLEVFTIMRKSSHHTFQILTKRPERMLAFMNGLAWRTPTTTERALGVKGFQAYYQPIPAYRGIEAHLLQNVHLYVSVENQYWADRRIPLLLQIPAAARGVSYEPALKAVDFSTWLRPHYCQRPDCPEYCFGEGPNCGRAGPGLSHIIMGGESGPGARPMHPDWVRSTRDQCVAAGVPFFFKQWGEWFPRSQWEHNPELFLPGDEEAIWSDDKRIIRRIKAYDRIEGIEIMHKVGKKKAGAMLDGREWREFPREAVTA